MRPDVLPPLTHSTLKHRILTPVMLRQEQRRVTDLANRVQFPRGAPHVRYWHVERKSRVAEACDHLGIAQRGNTAQTPRVVGLAGPSGAGKSTLASMIVAREDVRAYFENGVLWLQVEQGAKDRLSELKSRLADMVYETVMHKGCRPPRKQAGLGRDPEDGVEYIVDVIGKVRLRFLVVADDVWDVEVLEALKRSGAWVLYTTRQSNLLPEHPQLLWLDQVLKEEAELVLRRAADLDDDAHLPEAAYELMERCGFAALDLAFVGRWSYVRGSSGSDGQAWRKVLDRIVKEAQERGEDGELISWRSALFRAGLDELAGDNPKNKELYLSLAVLPKGLAFPSEVAAVLLYGSEFSAWEVEAAEKVMVSLESWSIVTLEADGKYRVHDEHSKFIYGRGTANQDVRERALPRWREYVSSIQGLVTFSGAWLVEIWERLALVGIGPIVRPYNAVLDVMDPSNTELTQALKNAADFHLLRKDYSEAEKLFRRVLAVQEDKLGPPHPDVARTLYNLGVCAYKAGRRKEAEDLFRRSLAIRQDKLGVDHPDVASTLYNLGVCAQEAERREEAVELYRRSLAIREKRLSSEHSGVARTLYNLGLCAYKAGRRDEAEKLYRRALSIQEDKLGPRHPDVARTLYNLRLCAQEDEELHRLGVRAKKAGRTEEAENFFRRSLAIQEDKLGHRHPDIARTLYNLGVCTQEAGRREEAVELYRRSLAIRENNKPSAEHPSVARILYNLGLCAQEAGGRKESEELYRRALAIQVKLGPQHPDVARTLQNLGVCAQKAGRTEEAEKLYRRALSIQEDKLGVDHPDAADTLHNLGGCALEAGRTEEARGYFRRARE